MPTSSSTSEITVGSILTSIRRKKTLALTVGLIVFAIAVLAVITMTRRYEATGLIQLQKSSTDPLDLSSMMGGGGAGDAGSDLTASLDLQTQADILRSDTLALRVIHELNLEDNRDFQPSHNPFLYLLSLVTPKGPADVPGRALEDSPARRASAIKIFEDHLNVQVTSGTRLISVSFTNRDPVVAAEVVNHLIQASVDFAFQTRFKATDTASKWLEEQLGTLRQQSQDLQIKVVQLQKESGIYGVEGGLTGGDNSRGEPTTFSPALSDLEYSSTQYSAAQLNRVVKQSIYEVVKTGDAALISQLAGTSMMGSSSQGVVDSLSLIQNLRQQEATLAADVSRDASVYGSAYPKLISERASLKTMQESLQSELQRIVGRAKGDFDVAVKTEAAERSRLDKARQVADVQNDKSIEYALAAKEAEQAQNLYQDLLKRLKEAGITEGLQSSNLAVVDPASPPAKPSTPKVFIILPLSILGGIFLGICAALLADSLDNKIQSAADIESSGAVLVSVLPKATPGQLGSSLTAAEGEFSPFLESLRRLRSNLLLSRGGKPPTVILVTSSNPGEGKSTIALSFASILSHFSSRVLLVEADLRRPVFAKRLEIPSRPGLSELLSDSQLDVEPRKVKGYENLYIVTAGAVPPYPAELLGTPRMEALMRQWREQFDFVVIDSPPVLPVADVHTLANFADATLVVVRAEYTSRIAMRRTHELLTTYAKNRDSVLGMVLNYVEPGSTAYYGYYGTYQSYEYRHTQEKS